MRTTIMLLLIACGSKQPEPTKTTPPPPKDVQCSGPPPAADSVCLQDCGPPVAKDGDPPPKWSWVSPADAKSRAEHGCPICLPPTALIATPDGDRPTSALTVGSRIYTVDGNGNRVVAHVLYVGSTPVSGGHMMVRVALADGRTVAASAGHPDAGGRELGRLHVGDSLDGSDVIGVDVVPFAGARTWDILPSGPTGLYVADGVVLRSSFAR